MVSNIRTSKHNFILWLHIEIISLNIWQTYTICNDKKTSVKYKFKLEMLATFAGVIKCFYILMQIKANCH